MVTTCWPSHAAASVRQDKTRWPSTMTVHAPQAPSIAPFLRNCQTEHIAEGIQQCQARVHRKFVGRVVHAKTRSHADCFPHSEDSRAHDTAPFLAAPFRASMALTLFSDALQKIASRAVCGWVLSATWSPVFLALRASRSQECPGQTERPTKGHRCGHLPRTSSTAARITSAVSFGLERNGRWPARRERTRAPIRAAISRCKAGEIMRSSSVTAYHEGSGTPRGFCHAIEKCAGPNGWLRGGEDPDLSC